MRPEVHSCCACHLDDRLLVSLRSDAHFRIAGWRWCNLLDLYDTVLRSAFRRESATQYRASVRLVSRIADMQEQHERTSSDVSLE